MAVLIEKLVDRFRNSVNAPGQSFVGGTDDQVVAALANAFWTARTRGLFAGYRVNAAGLKIEPVSGAEDLDDVDQQLVVMFAALLAIEAKLLELTTSTRYKSGEQEYETQRSAQVLLQLLKAKRAELDEIRADIVAGGTAGSTRVHVIDSFTVRADQLADSYAWVA